MDRNHPLVRTVRRDFGNTLNRYGMNSANPKHACIGQAMMAARGRPDNGLPDGIITLNDCLWASNKIRAKRLLPVGIALYDYEEWSPEMQNAFKEGARTNLMELLGNSNYGNVSFAAACAAVSQYVAHVDRRVRWNTLRKAAAIIVQQAEFAQQLREAIAH